MKRTACWTNSLQCTGPTAGDYDQPIGGLQSTTTKSTPSDQAAAKKVDDEEEEEEEEQHAEAVAIDSRSADNNDDSTSLSSSPAQPAHKSLTEADKLAYGLACKRLIDWGRMEYLKAAGLKSELVLYCPPSISPENACVIAIDTRLPSEES